MSEIFPTGTHGEELELLLLLGVWLGMAESYGPMFV